jgi:hypothetical protein
MLALALLLLLLLPLLGAAFALNDCRCCAMASCGHGSSK